MNKQSVTTAIVLVVLLIATASGQSGRRELEKEPSSQNQSRRRPTNIRQIANVIENMESRIERLEARVALTDATIIENAPQLELTEAEKEVNPKDNVLQLLRVELLANDPGDYEKLNDLEEERNALERTVNQMRKKVASMSGRSGGSSSGYRGGGGSKDVSGSRQRAAQGQLLADWQSKYRKKMGEYKRLERELKRPKQIIHGHWGNKVITLRTTKDVSNALNRIDAGDYLTWTGRRLRFDSTSEEWVVTSVRRYNINDAN